VEARQILGARYRLEERLGEGGMAVVWRAFDLVLGRWVAVKVLSAALAADAHFRESILSEAQAAARVSHPHLAAVYDYGESLNRDGEPIPYVVMELLTGRTLTERLASGPLPPRAGLRVCAEIASGLATAHAANLVHQDVKPGNVMLTPTGAKLVDFGVAAIAGAPDGVAPGGKIMGTPNYVSPERLIGGAVVPATDVYGLGLLIFRVLTGQLPWPAGKPRLATRAEPDPLPAMDGVPPAIGELYERCLAMNPDDRPTAREAATILAGAVGVRPVFGDGDGDDDDGDSDGEAADDGAGAVAASGLGDLTTGEQLPALVGPSGAHRTVVPDPSDRRIRTVGAVVAALAAVAAAMLIFSFNGQTSQTPPSAGGSDPTSGIQTSDGAPSGTAAGAPPGVGGEPQQPYPSMDGTRTVWITPTPGPPGPPTGPGGPPPVTTTDPGQPPPPTTPSTRTFTYDGNVAVARCVDGDQAEIIDWTPAPGYMLTPPPRPGPADTARIWFRMQNEVIIMVITCVDGVPHADISNN
jgi:eukaryotic-like serine/threonine-protein kinase